MPLIGLIIGISHDKIKCRIDYDEELRPLILLSMDETEIGQYLQKCLNENRAGDKQI